MKNMLYKEFKLAMHPTNILFLFLSAMMLIPSYPLLVVFFYSTLGLFFTCLGGRENHDIEYSLFLPVEKKDVVNARMLYSVIMECVQLLLCAGLAVLRGALGIGQNEAGMDANVAFFGFGCLLYGIFNYVFFVKYYTAPDKVGRAFAVSSVVTFVFIGIVEACTFILPLFKSLDTPDPAFMPGKIAALRIGIALYAVLTLLARRRAIRAFNALDF